MAANPEFHARTKHIELDYQARAGTCCNQLTFLQRVYISSVGGLVSPRPSSLWGMLEFKYVYTCLLDRDVSVRDKLILNGQLVKTAVDKHMYADQ